MHNSQKTNEMFHLKCKSNNSEISALGENESQMLVKTQCTRLGTQGTWQSAGLAGTGPGFPSTTQNK